MRIAIYGEGSSILVNILKKASSYKIFEFFEENELINSQKPFDIYLLTISEEPNCCLFERLKQIHPEIIPVYAITEKTKIKKMQKLQPYYFVFQDGEIKELIEVLSMVKSKLKHRSTTISTSKGDIKVLIEDINYINIENRSLCVHLKNDTIVESLKLRRSFSKETQDLLINNSNLYFIEPSLIINLINVIGINKNYVYFRNNTFTTIPTRIITNLTEKWQSYLTE